MCGLSGDQTSTASGMLIRFLLSSSFCIFAFILLILRLFYTSFSIMSKQTFSLKILKMCILTVLLHRVIQTNCLIKSKLLYSLNHPVKHKKGNPAELYFTHGLNTIETH